MSQMAESMLFAKDKRVGKIYIEVKDKGLGISFLCICGLGIYL